MKNPPIKRHAALVPFSHDHNVALYHAKRLQMASGLGEHLDPGTAELKAAELEPPELAPGRPTEGPLGQWGSPAATRQAWADFHTVWRGEISQHFDDEERELIPLLADQGLIDRLLRDHVELRALVAQAETAAKSELTPHDLPLFGQLGLALTTHIRWEERTLFNYVQDHTDDAGLERLRKATAAMEQSRPTSKARGTSDSQ